MNGFILLLITVLNINLCAPHSLFLHKNKPVSPWKFSDELQHYSKYSPDDHLGPIFSLYLKSATRRSSYIEASQKIELLSLLSDKWIVMQMVNPENSVFEIYYVDLENKICLTSSLHRKEKNNFGKCKPFVLSKLDRILSSENKTILLKNDALHANKEEFFALDATALYFSASINGNLTRMSVYPYLNSKTNKIINLITDSYLSGE